MATTFSFADRFSYPAADGVGAGTPAVDVPSLSDADLEAESQDLADMARMVRAYSLLLQRRGLAEIFNVITTQSDPRIAFILAAAKSRKDNTPLFGGLGAVKEIMFNDPSRSPSGTGYVNRNLFSDGIRRISAAFTAAQLISQLSQVKEQAEHAQIVEKNAIADLNRLVETYELSESTSQTDAQKEVDIPVGFFFEPKDLVIPAEKFLRVEWQVPGVSSSWSKLSDFTGPITTWEIVSALADEINSQTILNPDTSLLAAADLSGPFFVNPKNPNSTQYHALLFYPRNPVIGVLAYSVNLRVETLLLPGQTDLTATAWPLKRSPFIWGNHGDSLNTYPVNGSMLLLRGNALTSVRSLSENYDPAVLYFRNLQSDTPLVPEDNSTLRFRVQPWQPVLNEALEVPEAITVNIPRLIGANAAEQLELDANRYSQVTVALLNALAELNVDTRVTGSILRNDPITATGPAAALELIAWSSSVVITHVVLDILEVPADVELATGNRTRAATLYSNNPKSVRVKNPFGIGGGVVDGVLKKEQAYVVKRPNPRLWQSILDESKSIEDPYYL